MTATLLEPTDPPPVTVINGNGASPFVLTCDHAGRVVPERLGDLGLSAAEMDRHIAYDLGAAALARRLSQRLDAPLVAQSYSRLVIDCNRNPDVAASIVGASDGTRIPANQGVSDADRGHRRAEIHAPYHAAITALLDTRAAAARPAILFSVHSCTPVMNGFARPWHAGLLYNRDPRFSHVLMPLLAAAAADLNFAFNQPYTVNDEEDYTIPIHGEARGLVHGLVEIRNDQLADETGVERWAELLAETMGKAATEFLGELEERS
ncbi:MAG: N-formylglutamate amidohydrolase [Alphaproteobacteria bacterium]